MGRTWRKNKDFHHINPFGILMGSGTKLLVLELPIGMFIFM
jgi:hypothetical protein